MSSHNGDVAGYYDDTWCDQRRFWANRRNLAIHMGYWDECTASHAESLDNINRVMAESVRLAEGESVLDAGCGVGGPAMWLAENFRVHVVGVTISAVQHAEALAHARVRGLAEQTRFLLCDYHDTGFPAGSFDLVWAQESVAHAPDKERFLAEAYRLLRPGGRIVVEDFFLAEDDGGERGRVLVDRWMRHMKIPGLSKAPAFERAAHRCGFRRTAVVDITRQTAPSFARYRRLLLLDRLSAIPNLLGLRSRNRIDNMIAVRAQTEALSVGCWFPGIFTAWK